MLNAPGPSYDAASILNFGQPIKGELPQAELGEVVIWYGGWSLQQLRNNPIVRKMDLMMFQDWYNEEDWSREVLPIGFYRLRIPVPNSNKKLFEEQTALLLDGEQVAHPLLVANTDLCHKIQTGTSLLEGIYVRTSKQYRGGNRVALSHCGGRLDVYSWDDIRDGDRYLASARDCA